MGKSRGDCTPLIQEPKGLYLVYRVNWKHPSPTQRVEIKLLCFNALILTQGGPPMSLPSKAHTPGHCEPGVTHCPELAPDR